MTKQIERQVRDLQKEMAEAQRERDLLRLRPCRGDMEIREKDEGLERLDKRIESIQSLIRELGKKRREVMSAAVKGGEYESPFSWKAPETEGSKREEPSYKAWSFTPEKKPFKFLGLHLMGVHAIFWPGLFWTKNIS